MDVEMKCKSTTFLERSLWCRMISEANSFAQLTLLGKYQSPGKSLFETHCVWKDRLVTVQRPREWKRGWRRERQTLLASGHTMSSAKVFTILKNAIKLSRVAFCTPLKVCSASSLANHKQEQPNGLFRMSRKHLIFLYQKGERSNKTKKLMGSLSHPTDL